MGSLREMAPALRACRYVESVSVMYRSNGTWIGFHSPIASLNCTIESPIVTSVWRILPHGSMNRSLSLGAENLLKEIDQLRRVVDHQTGVMVWYPSGIGFT